MRLWILFTSSGEVGIFLLLLSSWSKSAACHLWGRFPCQFHFHSHCFTVHTCPADVAPCGQADVSRAADEGWQWEKW